MLRISRPSPALVIASVALMLALGGVTYASIPGPDGTVHSCVGSRGTMRVIDSSATCDPSEQALNFSQTGPQGSAGPAGPPGQSQLLNFAHDISVKVPRKAGGAPVGSFDLPEGRWAITLTGGVTIPASKPVGINLSGGGGGAGKAHAAAMVDFRNARAVRSGPNVSCTLALGDGSVRQALGNGGLIGLLVPAVQGQHGTGGGGGSGRTDRAAIYMQLVQEVPAGGGRASLACLQGKGKAGFSSPAATVDDVSIIAVRVDQVGALAFTAGH